ncbi:hypothetical protein BX283_0453 [Streptomyces sp. TLI_146]|nr:hypothetical protein BX283_0453 [Streptomyces sp. TLI_146]
MPGPCLYAPCARATQAALAQPRRASSSASTAVHGRAAASAPPPTAETRTGAISAHIDNLGAWIQDTVRRLAAQRDINGDGRSDIGMMYRFADGAIKMFIGARRHGRTHSALHQQLQRSRQRGLGLERDPSPVNHCSRASASAHASASQTLWPSQPSYGSARATSTEPARPPPGRAERAVEQGWPAWAYDRVRRRLHRRRRLGSGPGYRCGRSRGRQSKRICPAAWPAAGPILPRRCRGMPPPARRPSDAALTASAGGRGGRHRPAYRRSAWYMSGSA